MSNVENGSPIGIIRSVVVFGRSEKHYDIIFYSDRIEILYLGEYKYSKMKQMLGRNADALIYRIIKNKKRSGYKSDRITIRADEIFSIRLRYIPVKSIKAKSGYLLLEINTTRGKYEFYINAKIAKTAKSIINKFCRKLREK